MLTHRLAEAFELACSLHGRQTRKGVATPYMSHLMAVSSMVLEYGGDENQAIAGLLHDAVEDQGGLATAKVIAERFGEDVAEIVLACTDATPAEGEAKPPWRERKSAFITTLPKQPPRAPLVITCDKIHNLSCLIADLERDGPATLGRFNHPDGLVWYYSSLAAALAPLAPANAAQRLNALAADFANRLDGAALPAGAALD